MYIKSKFCIDGGKSFEGYSIKGRYWNGWERPLFTKETCDNILAHFEADDISYKDEKYIGITADGELYDIDPIEIIIEGEKLIVYEIGDGWIWDKVEDEVEEDPYDENE